MSVIPFFLSRMTVCSMTGLLIMGIIGLDGCCERPKPRPFSTGHNDRFHLITFLRRSRHEIGARKYLSNGLTGRAGPMRIRC